MSESWPDPLLVQFYERYLMDQDVEAFLRRISASYLVGTLERLAFAGQCSARRAAVFSLGRLASVLPTPSPSASSYASVAASWCMGGSRNSERP